ncbi:unnamed protein product [Adineta ricciae]|uniref:Uncharacterized protein n=1 Tax=Adineta ricciae TaxID=249248 RepID=A0A813U1N5_ADIRI|nr:unnamed protein product [Adineta ricciae]
MLRYNFLALQLTALTLAIIAITTSSWEKVILKDDDALQTIYHSPLLTTLTTPIPPPSTHPHNVTGYILTINSGLMDICAHLQHPTHTLYQPPQRCKQTVARPSIGLAIIGVIFVVIGIACTGFADEEVYGDRHIRWLCYGSALSAALGGLLLFTCHWTYSLSSELQLPTAFVRYGYSTYLIVTSAVLSLLSMGLVLWRIYLCRDRYNHHHHRRRRGRMRSARQGRR